jgi:hypothetical protein
MVIGGRTPEELETLFEDALLLRDREATAQLFEARGLLVVGGGLWEAHGREQIARIAADVTQLRGAYLADPRQVLRVRDTALVLGANAVNVVRRGKGGYWRYLISHLDPTGTSE